MVSFRMNQDWLALYNVLQAKVGIACRELGVSILALYNQLKRRYLHHGPRGHVKRK
jgi:hypothetical protein